MPAVPPSVSPLGAAHQGEALGDRTVARLARRRLGSSAQLDELYLIERNLGASAFGTSTFGTCERRCGLAFRLLQRRRFFLGPDARFHAEPFCFPREGNALLRRNAEPVGCRLLIKECDFEMLFRREDHEESIAAPL